MDNVPTPRRRFRPRFRLQTFLVVVTIFCVWLGWHIHGTRRQREAVAGIWKAGGTVTYSYQMYGNQYRPNGKSWAPRFLREMLGKDFFHTVVEVTFESTSWPVRKAPVRHVANLPKLVSFRSDMSVDDSGLERLSQLARLKHLCLTEASRVTDEGVGHLKRLRHLKDVTIIGSQMSDTSLGVFSQMPNLENLQLPIHQFTDEGVSQLRSLQKLRVLGLTADQERPSGITDEGLRFLMELDDLRSLYVQYTEVTSEFEEQLKARFPQCRIYR